jgi:hypothetical protein
MKSLEGVIMAVELKVKEPIKGILTIDFFSEALFLGIFKTDDYTEVHNLNCFICLKIM